jgi:transcriptional regulator with XRE-family HTH domain
MTRYATSAPQRLVGWYLRDYRESAGYDLADAARVLGCSRSKISRVEAGQRGIPAKELCALLAGYGARPAVMAALALSPEASTASQAPQARRRPLRPRAAPLPAEAVGNLAETGSSSQ